jgi:hypothetical protein
MTGHLRIFLVIALAAPCGLPAVADQSQPANTVVVPRPVVRSGGVERKDWAERTVAYLRANGAFGHAEPANVDTQVQRFRALPAGTSVFVQPGVVVHDGPGTFTILGGTVADVRGGYDVFQRGALYRRFPHGAQVRPVKVAGWCIVEPGQPVPPEYAGVAPFTTKPW